MTMNVPKAKDVRNGAWGILPGSDAYHASSDASLFTSSLPVLPHEKCMINYCVKTALYIHSCET